MNQFMKTFKRYLPAVIGIILALLGFYNSIQTLALILIAASLFYPISGFVKKQLDSPGKIVLYSLFFVAFTAFALFAIQTNMTLSMLLLAAGFLTHAAWDLYHHRINKVVPRWYTKFCIAYDTLIALILIYLAL